MMKLIQPITAGLVYLIRYIETRRTTHINSASLFIKIVLQAALIFYGGLVSAQPTITSFTPISGKVGSSVTISGTNFDADIADNIVYFGGIRASVIAASTTDLTVIVPSGATYAPLTVTVNGLTAYSNSFLVTFDGQSINANSLDTRLDFSTGNDTRPNWVTLADLDGDGKLDIVSANIDGDNISVLRNTSSGGGSITFATHQDFSTAFDPLHVVTGDLDGDGKLDIVASNNTSDSFSAFRNTSSGPGNISFAAKEDFTVGPGVGLGEAPLSAVIGDLDRDGKPEVIITNFNNSISVFKNTSIGAGDIGFTRTTNYLGQLSVPRSGKIIDLDGDGLQDLILANSGGSHVSVIPNTNSTQGTISLGTIQNSSVGGFPYSVSVGDLDGDNKIDLMTPNLNDIDVSVLRNTSSGSGNFSFAAKQDFPSPLQPISADLADINGDGKLDILVAREVAILENTTASEGNITFNQGINFSVGQLTSSVAVGDLDGDKRPDVVAAIGANDEVGVFRNIVPLAFDLFSSLPTQYQNNVIRTSNITLTFNKNVDGNTVDGGTPSDFTDDNIIVIGEQTGIIGGIWSGGGTTTLTFDPTNDFKSGESISVVVIPGLSVDQTGENLIQPFTYSFNIASEPAPEMPPVFDQHIVATNADGAVTVRTVDIDMDGDMDLISASADDDKISWYENDGNQNFMEKVISTSADFAIDVFPTDLDRDGDIDLISASRDDDRIVWYENDGEENFMEHDISTTADGARMVRATDMNGDGNMDVLAVSVNDNTIAWYENDGDENFIEREITTMATGAASAFAIDVDGDGDVDCVTASGDGKISWYENEGNEVFTPRDLSTVAQNPQSVYATDLDNDGDVDILTAAYDNDEIAWFKNDGNQNFMKMTISSTADGALHVNVADVDGDGDMDVLSASGEDDKVAWYVNDGNAVFTEKVIALSTDQVQRVFTGDIDGDGDLDLLSASYGDDKIAWYENLEKPPSIEFASKTDITKPGNILSIGNNYVITAQENSPQGLAFNQDGTKMYVVGSSGEVNQFSVNDFDPFIGGSHDNPPYNILAQETNPLDIAFSKDGRKMFIVGSEHGEVNQYTLTIPFDVTSGVIFDGSPLNVATEDAVPTGIAFNPQGTKMFLVGTDQEEVNQYSLSTPFEIRAGVSHDGSPFDISPWETGATGIAFNADGTRMYISGIDGQDINQFLLSTPFDITAGATPEGSPLDVTSEGPSPTGLVIVDNGTKLVTVDNISQEINSYNLLRDVFIETVDNDGSVEGTMIITLFKDMFSNPGGTLSSPQHFTINNLPSGLIPTLNVDAGGMIATLSLDGNAFPNGSAQAISELEFTFTNDAFNESNASDVIDAVNAGSGLGIDFAPGSTLPILEYVSDVDLSRDISIDGFFDPSSQGDIPSDLAFNPDGTKIFISNEQNNVISQYSLADPFNVTTGVSYDGVQLDASLQENPVRGFSFSADGTKLFLVGNTRSVHQYSLTNPFDFSSGVSYDNSFFIASLSVGTRLSGITSNPDGSKMYITSDFDQEIYQLSLSNPFDVTSGVSIDGSAIDLASISSQNSPSGIIFNADGTKCFIPGWVTFPRVFQYSLTTPYDLTAGLSYDDIFMHIGTGAPLGVAFNLNASKMFIAETTDRISQYSLEISSFEENDADDGSVSGKIILKLTNDTFTNAGGLLTSGSDYTINNLPAGLTPMLSVADNGLSAVLTLSGNALAHENDDDVSDLNFTFENSAFTGGDASLLFGATNANSGFGIDFFTNNDPVFVSNLLASFPENQNGVVFDLDANDGDGGLTDEGITYSIIGGDDQSLLFIDSNTGEIGIIQSLDFESPLDANADNKYESTIRANDGLKTTDVTVTIEITNVNEPPVFLTSTDRVLLEESNQTLVVGASDEDAGGENVGLTFSLTGGNDANLFTIEAATGVLSFLLPPDFEIPGDADGDNVYEVEISASDGTFTTVLVMMVTVLDGPDANRPQLVNPIADQESGVLSQYTFSVPSNTFSDADGDVLTLSSSLSDDTALPTWLTFDGSTFTGSPGLADVGLLTIKVTATDPGGLSVSDEFQLNITPLTGINDEELDKHIVIYPNPTDGMLSIEINQYQIDPVLRIIDLRGRLIQEINVGTQLLGDQITIDLTNLMKGEYILMVTSTVGINSYRILKE